MGVKMCSGINVSPGLGFMGSYAVRTEYQGLGIGSALWRKAMEHIGNDLAGVVVGHVLECEKVPDT